MWWVVFHQLRPRHKYYTIRFLAFLPDRSLKIRIRAKSRQQPTICHPVTRVGWRNERLRYKTLVYTFKAKLTGNETRNCYHLILKDVCCIINPFEHVLVPKGIMRLMVLHTGAMKKKGPGRGTGKSSGLHWILSRKKLLLESFVKVGDREEGKKGGGLLLRFSSSPSPQLFCACHTG